MHQRPGFLREVTVPLIASIVAIVAFALVMPTCAKSAQRELIEARIEGRVP
jgi:hypothetical protein